MFTLNSFDIIQDKVVRNGKVAVLISEGHGAGWYTWNMGHPELLFLPTVVEMVLNSKYPKDIAACIDNIYGKDNDIYIGGLGGLTVVWVPQGADFQVYEYDGAEHIRLKDRQGWITA
jgi:hypothetical protein